MLDSIEYVVPAKNFIAAVIRVAEKMKLDCPELEEYSDIKEVMKRIKELGTFEAVFGGDPASTPEPAAEPGASTEPEIPADEGTAGPPTA